MLVYLLLLLVGAAQVQPASPPRDGASPKSGSASLSGRITEQDSNRPLHRAIVTLVPSSGGRQLEALTDAEGRYEFVSLAPGEYGLVASAGDLRATHLRQAFGRPAPLEPGSRLPRSGIELKVDERRTGVDVSLARALAIEGRVIDPWGEPMAEVEVAITRADGTPYPSFGIRSDDRGDYRTFGLAPGRYRVCAESQGSVDVPSDSSRFVRTCHPAAVVDGDAADIVLTTSDASGIDIHVQRSRTFIASGTVADAAGTIVDAPQALSIPPTTLAIRGRVTDKESGAPIPRAIVHLTRRDVQEQRTARTDAQGRYELTGLAPGEYSGFVLPGEHRATYLMAPLDALRRGLMVLKEGELREELNVALERSLAMTVRVVDEWGEPLAGVGVRVRSAGGAGGEYGQPFMRTTDDRGLLRVYQLPPGRYLVCPERSSRFRADSSGRERFLRTCYPSAASEAQAEPVQLGKADLDGVVIQMRLGRTFTISGTVVGANGGVPRSPRVSLERFEPNGTSGTSVTVDTGGHFSVSDVSPGDYAIQASSGGSEQPEQRQDFEAAFQPVVIESSDVDGVVVAMSKAVDVAGRFVAEEGNIPSLPPGTAGFVVSARLAGDELLGQGSGRSATMTADHTFLLTRMFGKRVLDVFSIPRGWYVKSIRYAGKEIVDAVTEFKAGSDPSPLEIVLSNRGATIAGRVLDERGEPVRGARVVMVPTDPARWSMFSDYIPVSAAGAFRLGPQRAGDYTVVAVGPSGLMLQPRDRARFAQLAAAGERITLGENEERVLDLTVVQLDQRR